jgi:excisionase family DNA binding protein
MAEDTQTREVMNLREAAQFLGVGERTLRRWMPEKGIPYARVGNLLRFRRSALLEWLAGEEQKTKEAEGGD